MRERRLNGNTICVNGHFAPSKDWRLIVGLGDDDPAAVFAPVTVSNPNTDAERAAALMRVVEAFRVLVSHWSYPRETWRRVRNEHATRSYTNIREGVRDNVLELLRLTRQLIAARRWDDARTVLERADNRWSLWIEQVEEMSVFDPQIDAGLAENVSRSFSEFGHDLVTLPQRALDAATSPSASLVYLAIGLAWLASRR